jgi:hypothetical protein
MPWSEQQALKKPPPPAPVPKVGSRKKKSGGSGTSKSKQSKKQESASHVRKALQSRLSVRRAAAKARGRNDGGEEMGGSAAGARRAPTAVVSKRATHTVRNSSESLLAAPSQRPSTSAVSPARSRASNASRSTFASVQARGRASSATGGGAGTGAMPGLHALSASYDRLYDVSLFNLVDELN